MAAGLGKQGLRGGKQVFARKALGESRLEMCMGVGGNVPSERPTVYRLLAPRGGAGVGRRGARGLRAEWAIKSRVCGPGVRPRKPESAVAVAVRGHVSAAIRGPQAQRGVAPAPPAAHPMRRLHHRPVCIL